MIELLGEWGYDGKVRKYKNDWVMSFMHPGGVSDNNPIKVKGYKEIIQVLKEQKFANIPIG